MFAPATGANSVELGPMGPKLWSIPSRTRSKLVGFGRKSAESGPHFGPNWTIWAVLVRAVARRVFFRRQVVDLAPDFLIIHPSHRAASQDDAHLEETNCELDMVRTELPLNLEDAGRLLVVAQHGFSCVHRSRPLASAMLRAGRKDDLRGHDALGPALGSAGTTQQPNCNRSAAVWDDAALSAVERGIAQGICKSGRTEPASAASSGRVGPGSMP